ncbi:MAG: HlyD family type I secretion periplasmic adaptor subunit [Mesorhizobium sp.]
MSELPAAVSPTIRLTSWSMIALLAAVVAGSAVARTEIVARGQGKVIAASRTQPVQPQADGRIVGIHVVEGRRVAAGDLLVEMDTTQAAADIKRLAAEIERQTLEAANAAAKVEALTGSDPADKAFVGLGRSAMRSGARGSGPRAAEAEARLAAELTALRDQVAQLDAETTRIARSRDAQQARLERSRVDGDIASRRFRSAEALRKGGTISESDFLDRLRETKAADADVAIAERELASLAAAGDSLLRQRAGVVSAAIAAHRKQASDAGIALDGLKAALKAAERRLADLSIRAPIAGKVEDLRVFTRGGYVSAGDLLMSIVPSDGPIEIEGLFDNRDIGFLRAGQRTHIKFDAFPAERYGIVRGRVTGVGADARANPLTGDLVYAVRVRPDRNGIQFEAGDLAFTPGMTATIDVVTGERRLISYFFEPILKALQDSFGER